MCISTAFTEDPHVIYSFDVMEDQTSKQPVNTSPPDEESPVSELEPLPKRIKKSSKRPSSAFGFNAKEEEVMEMEDSSLASKHCKMMDDDYNYLNEMRKRPLIGLNAPPRSSKSKPSSAFDMGHRPTFSTSKVAINSSVSDSDNPIADGLGKNRPKFQPRGSLELTAKSQQQPSE